jgi:hypothetical protein
MKDRDFLIWIHERLEHVHGENPLLGYMHTLRRVIAKMPADKSSDGPSFNGLEELKKHLGIDEKAT